MSQSIKAIPLSNTSAILTTINRLPEPDKKVSTNWRYQTIKNWQSKLQLHQKECDLFLSITDRQYSTYNNSSVNSPGLLKQVRRMAKQELPELIALTNQLKQDLKNLDKETPIEEQTVHADFDQLHLQLEAFEKNFKLFRLGILEVLLQRWPITIY